MNQGEAAQDLDSGTRLKRGQRSAAAGWLMATLVIVGVLPAIISPNEFFKDDSYFYLQIADNIVGGQGSTFHGVTPTNGYHPLWMGGAVAAVWLADGDRVAALHVVAALQALLLAGIALLFVRLLRAMGSGVPVPGLVVLLGYFIGTGLSGSEAYLNALTLLAGMLLLWKAIDRPDPGRWLAAGLMLGLSLLARLDNVFIVFTTCAIGLVVTLGRQPRLLAPATLALGIGGLIVVAPYLAWNVAAFGHLTPISGAIKSTFPAFDLDLGRLGSMGRIAALFGLLALFIGLVLDAQSRRRVIWLGLGSGVLIHATYVAGFTDHYTFWPWYYVPGVIVGALAVSYLTERIADILRCRLQLPALGLLVTAVSLAAFSLVVARAWLKAFNPIEIGSIVVDLPVNEYRWAEEFGQWMSSNMQPGQKVFAFDWPGALAYYSRMRIIPMDGLVSDFTYNDELVAVGAQEYLCSHGIGYYFGLLDEDQTMQRVRVFAPLTRVQAGELLLGREQIVVKVRDVVSRPEDALRFAVWRLECGVPRSIA